MSTHSSADEVDFSDTNPDPSPPSQQVNTLHVAEDTLNTNTRTQSSPRPNVIKKTSFLQDVTALFLIGKHKRNVQYEMLLDKLPPLLIAGILAALGFIILICVAIGMIFLPNGYHRPHAHLSPLTRHHLLGHTPLVHEMTADEAFSTSNLHFIFYMRLPMSNVTGPYFSISKSDFQFTAVVYGRNSDADAWDKLTTFEGVHTRKLSCSQTSKWLYHWDTAKDVGEFRYIPQSCNEIPVIQEMSIRKKLYKVEITFSHLSEMRLFLHGDVLTRFEATSSNFVIFETIIRYIYCALAVVLFVWFTFTMVRTQQFRLWNTQQKWLPLLLFLLIGLPDPFFAFGLVFPTPVFRILSVIVISTFFFAFMLYLLIFFHSLFTRRSERTYIFFYGTKIVFILLMFIINMTSFIWEVLYVVADPATSSIEDIPEHRVFTIIGLTLFLVYAVWLLYYVFKCVRNAHKFRKRYSARVKVIGLSSFIVLVASGITSTLMSVYRDELAGTAFLLGYTLIMSYFTICALTFVPSTQVAPPKLAPRPDPKKVKREERQRAVAARRQNIDAGMRTASPPQPREDNQSDAESS